MGFFHYVYLKREEYIEKGEKKGDNYGAIQINVRMSGVAFLIFVIGIHGVGKPFFAI